MVSMHSLISSIEGFHDTLKNYFNNLPSFLKAFEQ